MPRLKPRSAIERDRQLIKLFKPFLPPGYIKAIEDTMETGMLTQGERVEQFEDELAITLQNKWVLTLNSGTAALHLALRLADIEPGDEVITTPMTCVATNVSIVWERAKIVWADIDPYTGLIDPEDVKRKITKKTKAIISVDWGGNPVDYFVLRQLADLHGIAFISDAAQALGANVSIASHPIPVGSASLAHMTAFSLQAIKTITTIDGGILTLSDDFTFERAKRLRWFGVPRDNDTKFRGELDVLEVGLKMHMNDVTAALGLAALPWLSVNVHAQKVNARYYWHSLSPVFACDQPVDGGAHWLYTVRLADSATRDKLRLFMEKQGIEVSQVHWRNDKHTAFREFRATLPGVDEYSSRAICIPVHNQLSLADLNAIVSAMNHFAEQ